MAQPRLLILCQLFYPEMVSTGQTVTELAEALVDQGVDVEVVAGPLTLMDQTTVIPQTMTHHGIRIFRVWGTRFPKLSLFGKLLNHVTYTLSVFWYLVSHRIDRPIVLFTNPPFLVGACAVVSLFKRLRLIYVLFDVYPDTAVQAGLFETQSVVVRLWHRFNSFCFNQSEKIVVIGRCMERVIRDRLTPPAQSKLHRMHVWADEAGIQASAGVKFRQKWENEYQFIIGYSGNLGRFHDIDVIVDAARVMTNTNASFIFIGEGYSKAAAQAKVKTLEISNCHFYSYVPREELGSVLSGFDIGLVSLKLGQEGLSVPSKTFGLMAAGKPIIAIMASDSEIALIVREAGCGWVVDPGDVNGLVQVIKIAMGMTREELTQMGQRGKQMSLDRYTAGQAARKLVEVIGDA